ncbi:Protein CLN3, putative [Perkinsus marinus ATCC 50983]|uniref:Protein CLN3, putative n=1 Tax=Perkinsus marinus (strain ATCC 50983 / TXsc) TaxID=423536 RepID=C5KHF3_PERM5|nr:Protein CLN3, putative [Perkinsus marinus ATCC 50983]EER16015.1 Protein CLN3, putative [Perkinsus marinus ATCC 50983]|eukprot:XP_002784219.1 Protein CLN3, putative [Perkinsus marinus ATCC 50983]
MERLASSESDSSGVELDSKDDGLTDTGTDSNNNKKDEDSAEHIVRKTYVACFVATTVCGFINNTGYNFVFTVSQDLAKQFHHEDAMSSFSMVLLAACFGMTILHSKFFLHFPFLVRIIACLVLQTVAYVLLAIACKMTNDNVGFGLSLAGAVSTGFSQALGEVLNLSQLHHLPPSLVGGWGLGTGLSGIFAPLIYMLFLNVFHWSRFVIMLVMNVLTPIYFGAFFYINREANKRTVKGSKDDETQNSAELNFKSFIGVCKHAGFIIFNLVAVYFLEYFIQSGFMDRASINVDKVHSAYVAANSYEMMLIGYNVGVTISRSSVTFFRIKWIWVPTVLQACNAIFWGFEATTHFIRYGIGLAGFYLYIPLAAIIGLMGGLSYVNCMYQIQRKEDIPDDLRQLSVNLGFASTNIGIVLASGLDLWLANTVLSQCNIYDCSKPPQIYN